MVSLLLLLPLLLLLLFQLLLLLILLLHPFPVTSVPITFATVLATSVPVHDEIECASSRARWRA